jgi:predicted transcriptional regulator
MNAQGGLRMISFRVDDETFSALEELAAAVIGGGVVVKNRRSIAIRRAVLEARERLRAKSGLTRKR